MAKRKILGYVVASQDFTTQLALLKTRREANKLCASLREWLPNLGYHVIRILCPDDR